MIKLIVFVVLFVSVISCQTKWNFENTGFVDGHFDGTMYEYLQSNHYDWDSTVLLIERAGLEDLFNGNDPEYKEITFLGPTNHSIRKWMRNNGVKSLNTIEPEKCKEMILRHVIKGKYMRKDIPAGKRGENAQQQGEGGQVYTSVGGAKLWLFTFQEEYSGVIGTGAVNIYLFSLDKLANIDIASSDIEPNNGVVHSLSYEFEFVSQL